MRILDQVIGHGKIIERLLKTVDQDRLPPSWLFVGAKNQGKKMVALGIAQAILCERSRAACGECGPCRRVANRQSEGLIVIEPEGATIKVETARQIVADLSLAVLGRGRVVVIDDAEKLGAQAGNALLKSVEEPPPRTHFILLTTSRDAVLGTLRSRSQVVRFGSLTDSECATLGREDADDEVCAKAREDFRTVFVSSAHPDFAPLRERVTSRETALLYLRLWLGMARDTWAGHETTVELSFSRLAMIAQKIVRAERDLQGHCDVGLTFENLINECCGDL